MSSKNFRFFSVLNVALVALLYWFSLRAAEEEQGKMDESKRKNVEMEKATAESVRKRSMERLSEARERESNAEKAREKQKMSPQSDAVEYLREKSQKDLM